MKELVVETSSRALVVGVAETVRSGLTIDDMLDAAADKVLMYARSIIMEGNCDGELEFKEGIEWEVLKNLLNHRIENSLGVLAGDVIIITLCELFEFLSSRSPEYVNRLIEEYMDRLYSIRDLVKNSKGGGA